MRLLTNPGSNLSDELIPRYRVGILARRITVDGVAHDTRHRISQEVVDGSVKRAKRWPTAIGTTAAESVVGSQDAVKKGERKLIVLTTSKKVIDSWQGANVAARTLQATSQGQDFLRSFR